MACTSVVARRGQQRRPLLSNNGNPTDRPVTPPGPALGLAELQAVSYADSFQFASHA
jgi:hypothetical protein